MLIRLQILPKTLIPRSHFAPKASSSKPLKTFTPAGAGAASSSDSGLKFRQKILYLQELRVNPAKALHKNPHIRSAPLAALKSVENCLHSMGIERSALGRILDMFPQLLTADPYADLYPVLDFLLNDVSIPFPDVRLSVIRCPRLLISGVETQLKPTLRFLEKFGFVGPYKITAQTTVLLVSSVELTLNPKIEYLMGLGFGYDEVVNMVIRSPGLLTFSIENNYRPKVDYFLREMKGDLEELKSFPQFFSFSLEGKIKPRHRLLVEHGFRLKLPEMLKISDGEFSARLVEMQLQLLENRHL
nr:transcription termination factor MTEF1, chloroplastic isoform X1 [Ipomoea trifida]